MKLVQRWLQVGVDAVFFGDDLGAQERLTLSPRAFRKWLLPAYAKMFGAVREAGAHVRLHSDGHIMEVAEDLVKAGVTILNVQDLVNGIDRVGRALKGKVCVDLDIDRQRIVPFGRPEEVEGHVEGAVSALRSREGAHDHGRRLPANALENVEALCRALERVGGGIKY